MRTLACHVLNHDIWTTNVMITHSVLCFTFYTAIVHYPIQYCVVIQLKRNIKNPIQTNYGRVLMMTSGPPDFRAASLLRLWASSAHPRNSSFLFSKRGRQLAFCCTSLCTVRRSWDHHMATFITGKMSEMNTPNSFQLICKLTNQLLVAALYYVQVLEVVMHLISAHTMASMPFTCH